MENLRMTLTIAEACEALNLSRPMVDRYIHRKENPLPCIKTGRRYVIPRAAFETWILEEAQRNSTGSAARR